MSRAYERMKRRLILLTVAISIIIGVSAGVRWRLAVEARDQPVTEADLQILQRAEALLKDPSTWNRHDDRVCDDDEALGKRSLFCALQKADTEVLARTRTEVSPSRGPSLRLKDGSTRDDAR